MDAATWRGLSAWTARGHAALGVVGLACATLVPVLVSAAVTSGRCLLELPPAGWGTTQLSAAITVIACATGAVGTLWHLLSVLLAFAACSGARRAADPDIPPGHGARAAARLLHRWGAPLVRRIAAGALIAGIATSPAVAVEESGPGTDDLGWQPTATAPADPGSPPDSAAPEQAAAAPRSSDSHTVAAGESLWSITAALLGPEASAAQVAEAWPRLYRANADAIGTDPGLIHPGTSLAVPDFSDQPDS
ncbi:hypothetical protein SAMN05216355_101322 [Actinomyces ruminicola]|uniref:LysM domain-containing protein n=1 Tax=Actinomyces ruminicola TaxID=332524 RepID=A0A1G9ZQR8_9ACTO|nr:LysM domain-containing protein [Actinomyces ruminicola]SDN22953.1 hypothetical protein SAMN05216355_101322 [Actinomyces ruminicola]